MYKKSILDEPHSPVVIYLPTKETIFKLMRACIGVNDIDNLWFNQGAEIMEEAERRLRLSISAIMITKQLNQVMDNDQVISFKTVAKLQVENDKDHRKD